LNLDRFISVVQQRGHQSPSSQIIKNS